MGRALTDALDRDRSVLFLELVTECLLATSSRSLGLIWVIACCSSGSFARLGYGLDEKSDQTTGDVHRDERWAKSSKFAYSCSSLSIFKRLNTLSQVVHDLTFILFAAAHFMSYLQQNFVWCFCNWQNYLYEICFDWVSQKPAKSVFVRCIHQNCQVLIRKILVKPLC